jgi:hypothetical protein
MKLLPMAVGVAAAPLGARGAFARRLAVGLGDGALVFLLGAALLIAERRLAGALRAPAEPGLLLAVAVFAAALAGGFRLTPRDTLRQPRWQRLLLAAAPALGLAVLGGALSVSGIGAWAVAALWGPMLAEELWAVWRMSRGAVRSTPPAPARRSSQLLGSAFGMITASLAEPQADGEVTQQFVRSHAADGRETLSGWLRLSFVPGQRQATAHLAFCPPFVHTPEFDVRQTEGPSARVKAGQILAYGARLEVKLAAPAEHPLAVRLQFSARVSASSGEPYVKPVAG